MDLRNKTLMVVGLSFGGLIVALYLILQFTLLNRFDYFEKQYAEKTVGLITWQFDRQSNDFKQYTDEYAHRPELRKFIETRDEEHLTASFDPVQSTNRKLRLIMVLDAKGKFLKGRFSDPETWSGPSWVEDPKELFGKKTLPDVRSGLSSSLLVLKDTPLKIAARPIKAAPDDRTIGYLVLGSTLETGSLLPTGSDEVDVTIQLMNAPAASEDISAAMSKLTRAKEPLIVPLSMSKIGGYTMLDDLYGQHAVLIKLEIPKVFTATGHRFAFWMVVALLVAILVFAAMLWLLLEKYVLSRLSQLSRNVAQIGSTADPKMRVKISGDDEIAELRDSINAMLSDLERSDAKLRDSESRFSALATAAFEGILIHDAGIIVDANRALLSMFGFERDELIGKDIAIFAPSRSYGGVRGLMDTTKEEPYESVGLRRDGSVIPLEVRVRSVEMGSRMLRVTALRDITERKHAEQALRESEDRYRRLFELAQEGIVSLDANANVTFLNPTFANVMGMRAEELVGRTLDDFSEDCNISQLLSEAHVKQPGKSATREVKLVTRDGTARFFIFTARPLYDVLDKHEGWLCVFTDITERKQTEQVWLNAQKAESLGVLAGGIAHDFNNLLVGIIGNVSLALDTLPSGSPVRRYLSDIDKASQRAAELVQQMLAYSGKGRMRIVQLDINNSVEEAIKIMGTSVPRELDINFEFAHPAPRIDADQGLIRQMITGLVLNSIESMEGQEGRLKIATGTIVVDDVNYNQVMPGSGLALGRYSFLSVSDNGTGMDQATLDRVFDPFFSTKFAGRGLGLAAVQGIVRRHNGFIQVESQPGKGSSFTVLFPCSATSLSGAMAGGAQGKKPEGLSDLADAAATGAPMLMLLIAEDETTRTSARSILDNGSFRVLVAANGQEGLTLYRQNLKHLDIVMLDLGIKDIDGHEVYRELRRISAKIPVILLGSNGAEEVALDPSTRAPEAYVRKPFSREGLLEGIEAAL